MAAVTPVVFTVEEILAFCGLTAAEANTIEAGMFQDDEIKLVSEFYKNTMSLQYTREAK